MTINLNEITLIVGEIGSGKSTLISLLLKFRNPNKGEIFFKGTPYSKIDYHYLRDKIFYIPQIPLLLNRSVYDNIVYGHEHEVNRDYILDIIHKQDLDTFLTSLPMGLDTSVGIHGSKLSGGQRQIIWILKAILVNPEVIIMDEPTASVDENSKEIINFLVQKIMKNRTVILITHDPYLLKFANRIITLQSGKVVKDERV